MRLPSAMQWFGRQSRPVRVITCFVLLLLLGIAKLPLKEDEPALSGIPASQWALKIFSASSKDPAVIALVEIGPSAIPSIIEAYEGHPNHFCGSRWYAKLREVSPTFIQRHLPLPFEPPINQSKCGMILALRQIRTKADRLEEFLFRETAHPDKSIRMFACEALGLIGYSSPHTIARLKELLHDPSGFVKSTSLLSLHRLNNLNDPALIPVLEELAHADHDARDESIRGMAFYALWSLNAPRSEQNLANFLSTVKELSAMRGVARTLKGHGEAALVFAPILVERLSSATNESVRVDLKDALHAITRHH